MPPSSGASTMERLEAAAIATGRATAMAAAGSGRFAVAAGAAVHLVSSDASTTTLLPLPHGVVGKPIASLAASHSGRLVAAGEKGSKPGLYLWAAAVPGTAQPPGQEIARALHSFSVVALAFSPSGRLLASHGGDRDYQVAIWAPTVAGTGAKQQGRTRLKESFDALAFVGEERLAAINRESLVVFALERCNTPGGLPMKLSAARTFALPASPAPCRFMGLAALPDAGARALPRLLAVAEGGRVLLLRPGGPSVERSVDLKDCHVRCMAASAEHVAVGCRSGLKLLTAGSLEPVAELALPAGSSAGGVDVCAFSTDGSTLLASTSGGELRSYALQNPCQPVLLRQQRQGHSEAITGAAAISGTSQLATCSLDGQLFLWDCAPGRAKLACCAALNLRCHLASTSTKLQCLAASPDGRVLTAGDHSGRVHIISARPSLSLLSSQAAVDGEISALAFGPGIGSSTPLLAVGSRSGAAAVLCLEADGSCTQLARLADHKGPVIGLAFTADGLATATATKRALYRWDTSAGQLLAAGAVALPRGSALVALAAAQQGSVLVGASKAGKATTWEAGAGGETGSMQLLDRMQGEVAALAVDEGAGLLVCATTRNHLLAFSLPGGKLLASGRAHLAGSAIGQVLIMPGAGCIVTAGDDSSVYAHPLPPSLASKCRPGLAAEQVQALAAVQPTTSVAESGSSAGSARIQPRDLSSLIDSAACSPSAVSLPAPAEGVMLPSGPATAQHAEQLPDGPAVEVATAEPPPPPVSLQRTASIPPSPNRPAVLAGRQQQQQKLQELEVLFAALPPPRSPLARKATTAAQEGAAQAPAPAVPSPPPASPPAAPAGPSAPASPAIYFGSPLETLSSISPGLLQSPDVFADLVSPPAAAAAPAGLAASQSLAAGVSAGGGAKPAAAAPASGAKAASLRRLAAMVGWRSSTRRPAGSKPAAAEDDPLAHADAERCRAMLQLSDGTGLASEKAAPSPASPAFFSPAGTSPGGSATVTVDVGGALAAAVPGSDSVNQPRRRRSWGPVPSSSEGPRRALSAHSLSSLFAVDASQGAEVAARAHSSLGLAGGQAPGTGDSWSVHQDIPASAATAAPVSVPGSTAGGGSTGPALSRRLSFSSGGFGGFGVAKKGAEEDTPTLQPKGGADPATAGPGGSSAFNLAAYHSPGLPAGSEPEQGSSSTPRLFLGGALSVKPPDALPAPAQRAQLAPLAEAQQLTATLSCSSVDAALPAATSASTAAAPAGQPSLGLQGRPPVPKLNLSTLAAGGAAPTPTIVSGKRSRLAREAGPPAESNGSTASVRPGHISARRVNGWPRHAAAAAQQPKAAAGSAQALPVPADEAGDESYEDSADSGAAPESKRSRALRRSPPRIIITSALFAYSAEKAKAPVRASADAPGSGRSHGSGAGGFWPAVASPLSAASSLCAASCSSASFTGDDDDPFCRPAAHDPLEGHATPAICLQPSPPPPLSGLPAGSPSASMASLGAVPEHVQPEPSAAAAAGAVAVDGAGAPGDSRGPEAVPAVLPATTVGAMLELLQQGLAGMASLEGAGSAALDAASKQKLAGLLGDIAAAGSRLTAGLPSHAAAAAPSVEPTTDSEDEQEQENAGGNAPAPAAPAGTGAVKAAPLGARQAAAPPSGAGQLGLEASELAAFKVEVRRELAEMKRQLLASRG
ncbi:hypothetical protein ABPG75_013837 [Micractinium tetrahymenae]